MSVRVCTYQMYELCPPSNSFIDAISLLGTGDVLIQGGGANAAKDKVVQHNGRGTVTIKDYTVTGAGKVCRGCGNCSNNGGPRKVIITGLKAKSVTSDVVGINSNYGKFSSPSLETFSNFRRKVTLPLSPDRADPASRMYARNSRVLTRAKALSHQRSLQRPLA